MPGASLRGLEQPKGFDPIVMAQASHLTTQLYRVEQCRRALTSEALSESHLTLAQWIALGTLAQSGASSMTELANASAVDRTSLTRTIDSLIPRGLVIRYTPASDRRTVIVEATPEGLALAEAIAPRLAALEQLWLAGLSDAEKDAFSEALDKMLAALLKTDGRAPRRQT